MIAKESNISDNLSNMLVSVLVHDLRQPFAAFIMIADTLKHTQRSLPQEELHILFEEIRCMTLKSAGLLDGLLCWMKSQKAGFTYESQPLILNDLIREANSLYLYEQSCKSITVYTVIPDCQAIYGHKEMLQFINRSILNNVTNHSPYGGTIGVTCGIEEDWITVAFTNQGSDITNHQLQTLFNNTGTAISNDSWLKGGGIALSICEDMICQMDGKLWTESLPNQGIVFYYSLPLVNISSE